jgi:hypothetical protein
MSTPATSDVDHSLVARGSVALVGTLIAGSFGLAAGIALVLLAAASVLWVP